MEHLDACIHELVTSQSLQTPDRIALIEDAHHFTYGVLNAESDKLAAALCCRAVQVETTVCIYIRRSWSAVVALLGTLKAGGVYCYLDPDYPVQRLRQMVQQVEPALIITSGALDAEVNCTLGEVPTIDMAALASLPLPRMPRERPSLDNAAYIMFTSGSSGVPKGVIEQHRSMTTRLSCGHLPDIQETDLCALNSSLGFGISSSRLFLPLAIGSTVAVISDNELKDIGRIGQRIAQHEVTSLFVVPDLLRHMMLAEKSLLSSIRAVVVSGGTLTLSLIESFRKCLPNSELLNCYGSSEIGTTAAMWAVGAEPPDRVFIGKPVINTRVYILDDDMNLADIGAKGELYVCSRHLARGYIRQSAQTAVRFVPNPFASEPGERLYRTGDFARWTGSGNIEFLGREDRQVKIRGFRIELEEIEAALASHADVAEVAVCIAGSKEDEHLIAWVVPRVGASVASKQLTAHLAQRLPGYMVPAVCNVLERLPTTAAGKVDRPSLVAAAANRSRVEREVVPARNAFEMMLAEIWSRHLKIDSLGINEDFFELGGHSLVAAGVISEIRSIFHLEISPEALFECPTIEMFASRVRADYPNDSWLSESVNAAEELLMLTIEDPG